MTTIKQDNTMTAGLIVLHYMWVKIKSDLGWSEDNYGGLVPIYPVQQQPEANSMTHPYLVFTSAADPVTPLWLIEGETIGITVYSSEIDDVNQVTQLAINEFKRYDESARDLNKFIAALPSPAFDSFRNFDFKTIRFMGASGAQPALQEGGRVDGDIILKVAYTQDR